MRVVITCRGVVATKVAPMAVPCAAAVRRKASRSGVNHGVAGGVSAGVSVGVSARVGVGSVVAMVFFFFVREGGWVLERVGGLVCVVKVRLDVHRQNYW